MPDGTEDAFEEVRRLLEAEAERRGVSGTELLDQLAREGRRPVVVDVDPQGDLSQWTAVVVDRGGAAKTVSIEPLPLTATAFGAGTEGAVILGAVGSGKTNAADLTRARLEAEGVPFEETVRTNEHGVEYVKFSVERPESAA
ncbi:hypothetical protein AB0958_19600 [Streptomyces sp. NPDC006655]|uniref:hypothetical protein n=1 Tax=Streptomyces sp. NPDC006655 TaxID=3156898 RepID=UPI003451B0D6